MNMIPFLEFIEKIDSEKPDFASDIRGKSSSKKKRDPKSSTTSLNEDEQALIN